MGEDVAPPYYAVTADNHSAWIVATSIIFLLYSIMGVVAKISLRVNYTRIKTPDILLMISLALMIAQTACIVRACNEGLGQHAAILDQSNFDAYSKFYYSASLLNIIILAITKISICLLISAINPNPKMNFANRLLVGLIVAWAVSGFFAIAFACGVPHPWRADNNGLCTARPSTQIYNGVMNIVTDLAICALPIWMMWNVQTKTRKKFQVCVLFGTRIVVPALTIPTLAVSGAYYEHIKTDPTWYAVVPVVLSQISVNLSVLTACIPGLKSILDSLLSGTANARIDGGYNLTSTGDRKSRWNITPSDQDSTPKTQTAGSGSGSRRSALAQRVAQRFRPESYSRVGGPSFQPAGETSGISQQKSAGSAAGDSTRHLAEDVIMRTDQYQVTSMQRNSWGNLGGISGGSRGALAPRISAGDDEDEISQVPPR